MWQVFSILLAVLLAIIVFANPVWIIHLIGFGPGGIVAGSCAAWLMSVLSPTPAGGFVAMLQSMGVLGTASPWAWFLIIPLLLILLCLLPCYYCF